MIFEDFTSTNVATSRPSRAGETCCCASTERARPSALDGCHVGALSMGILLGGENLLASPPSTAPPRGSCPSSNRLLADRVTGAPRGRARAGRDLLGERPAEAVVRDGGRVDGPCPIPHRRSCLPTARRFRSA